MYVCLCVCMYVCVYIDMYVCVSLLLYVWFLLDNLCDLFIPLQCVLGCSHVYRPTISTVSPWSAVSNSIIVTYYIYIYA